MEPSLNLWKHFEPVADLKAVVLAPRVRFTVLTSRLIRMEYSLNSQFEDQPSQAFWYRQQPLPEFKVKQSSDLLDIETEHLHLAYHTDPKGFTPEGLTVKVKGTGQSWSFGDPPHRAKNLSGTARTLDNAKGMVRLEPGLVSRAGWAVVDDSETLVFNDDGWLEPRSNPGNLDLYFFGYGHDYLACLREFSQVAGNVPLVPRWILGNWWSRYWAYTQDELVQLMEEFLDHQAPLSVCIVDMDWHITQTGNRSSGWTGYTWNRDLFPDPQGFIERLHDMGLKTALNLHPAGGIHPHEQQYLEFAVFMGLDPDDKTPVAFDCTDPKFIRAYFELLHHPYEAQGVDFWWLDWQQGVKSSVKGLDPLWWLNHLHFYDLGRAGTKRPFIFSRWGGLGNHRYPIGFSGDTVIGWEALQNLPGFTATAANVGYGWWSHDIGGHMCGIEDDELYARWLQYGVFSPVFRLHSTNNPFHDRRPWGRGLTAKRAGLDAMRLRWSLIPYIYSMAWRHHTTSTPLILPMYYSHPENPAAYVAPQQYWFGSELLAAPFTSPAHPETGLSRQAVWLPDGKWFNFFTGECLRGEGWRAIYGNLEDIPVFARAGAIVPLGPSMGFGKPENPEEVHLVVFPGADNRFELVEDDGETTAYQQGEYAVTVISQSWHEDSLKLTINPVRSDPRFVPPARGYHISFRGIARPADVTVSLNGFLLPKGFTYDSLSETIQLSQVVLAPSDELVVEIGASGESLLAPRDRTSESLFKALSAFHLESLVKQKIDQKWPLIRAGEISLQSFTALTDAQLTVLENLL